MNRIDKLRHQGASAFMPYVCAGDPNPELTTKLFRTPEEVGVDLNDSWTKNYGTETIRNTIHALR